MTNIVKLSGSKAKKEPVPLSVRIAAVANALAVKDREWRAYSDEQDRRRQKAESADDSISQARATWQTTINKKIKEEGYCEITSIHVNATSKKLVLRADCNGWKNEQYPVVKIVFTFGFSTDEEFNHQIGTLKGVLIAASRGKE